MNPALNCISIEELRQLAKRRLPSSIFDFYDGGATDELTLQANLQSFQNMRLLPRVLRGVSAIDTSQFFLGANLCSPLIIAPTGALGYGKPGADTALAKAAAKKDLIYTLSSAATTSIEEIARKAPGRHWFQAYVLKNKDFFYSLIDRALAADYEGLVITVDLPVGGKRERDHRNHFSIPFNLNLSLLLDFLTKPRWLYEIIRHGMPVLENMIGLQGMQRSVNHLASSVGRNYDPSFNWDDLKRVRDRWHKKLIIKGVMHPEDASKLVDLGCDALVVSNHGGRQLDTAVSSLDALPGVLSSVDNRIPVLLDSGVRRGSDILKALALGARAVLTGRATLYGAICGGELGALHAVDILQDELVRTMQLCGVSKLEEITQDLIFKK